MRMTPSIVVTGCVLCSLLVPLPSFPFQSTSSVPSPVLPVSSVLARDEFILIEKRSTFLLQFTSGGAKRRSKIPRHWLIPPNDEKLEQGGGTYVSSFNYDKEVTSFPIGNGQIGLHLSSFEAIKEGSAQAAAGRDVFLSYDPKTGNALPGLIELGVTKDRVRAVGCFRASTTHLLLSDIDQDGLQDIGVIRELLECRSDDQAADKDRANGPLYRQEPVRWRRFEDGHWRHDPSYDGILPARYADFPLVGMKMSPVDFVGSLLWKTFDPVKWNSAGTGPVPYQPEYRQKLIEQGLPSPSVDGKQR